MKAPANTSKPRVLCPRGIHLSRLVQVVDLGTQHFKQGDDGSRKLYFGFETCSIGHVFDEAKGEEPYMLQIEFAFYMTSANPSKQTKLRQFVVQWFGKDFPNDKAAQDFEFADLIGKLAMLTVAHKPKVDGSMKAVIADIYLPSKEEKGKARDAHNPLVVYEVENGEDDNFDLLPNFLQNKVRESDEFSRTVNKPDIIDQDQTPEDMGDASSDDEPLPF